jgi:hypothetical protein
MPYSNGNGHEDPDRISERLQAEQDECYAERLREDRIADYTPANCSPGGGGAQVTSAMQTLAYTVLNGPDHDRRDAARVLAQEVLEASG